MTQLNKSKRPMKSHSEIQQDWERIQSLEIKDAMKAMRAVTHDIIEESKRKDINRVELELYIEILKKINRVHNIPRSKICLTKMIKTWLELTGNTEATIISKLSGKI